MIPTAMRFPLLIYLHTVTMTVIGATMEIMAMEITVMGTMAADVVMVVGAGGVGNRLASR